MKVTRFLPAYTDCFSDDDIYEIEPNLKSLMNLDFIKIYSNLQEISYTISSLLGAKPPPIMIFNKFSLISKTCSFTGLEEIKLIAEYNNGKIWYVVATLDQLIEGLTLWKRPSDEIITGIRIEESRKQQNFFYKIRKFFGGLFK